SASSESGRFGAERISSDTEVGGVRREILPCVTSASCAGGCSPARKTRLRLPRNFSGASPLLGESAEGLPGDLRVVHLRSRCAGRPHRRRLPRSLSLRVAREKDPRGGCSST